MLYPKQALGENVVTLDACSSENSGAPSLVTAGGTGDNTKRTGQTVDRYQNGGFAQSAVVSTAYLAALGAGNTLSLAHEIQESADNSSWDTAVALEALTVYATDSGAGSNMRGVASPAALQLNLTAKKRYFRINVTPDLNRANTDTMTFHTQVVLGGFDVIPQ